MVQSIMMTDGQNAVRLLQGGWMQKCWVMEVPWYDTAGNQQFHYK